MVYTFHQQRSPVAALTRYDNNRSDSHWVGKNGARMQKYVVLRLPLNFTKYVFLLVLHLSSFTFCFSLATQPAV